MGNPIIEIQNNTPVMAVRIAKTNPKNGKFHNTFKKVFMCKMTLLKNVPLLQECVIKVKE